MNIKSVIAGEYTAPPAQGPMMALIWGIMPLASVLRRKIRRNRPATLTPSWIRAPPESFRPITGAPIAHRQVHDLADFQRIGFRQRAAEHSEILRKHVDQPPVDASVPGDEAIARGPLFLHAEIVAAVRDNSSSSSNVPSSSSSATRSRAVQLASLVLALAAFRTATGFRFGVRRRNSTTERRWTSDLSSSSVVLYR